MRKTRFIENCRCYHLISRLYPPAVRLLAKLGAMRGAHRAFFLDDDEKTRAVELLRRVEEFCGVMVLAYAIMSNHFHEKSMREAMGEVLAEREVERAEREAKGEPALSRRTDPPPSKANPGLAIPRKHGVELERGRPEIVERILKLLESGPQRSSAIRKAVGICSGIHLSRYYLTPMMEKERIFVSHPYNVNPNELDEMRSVLDACGVDMIWFQDSWYHENTWRIELRNAKIRSAIANGESRKALKQGRHSVLVG